MGTGVLRRGGQKSPWRAPPSRQGHTSFESFPSFPELRPRQAAGARCAPSTLEVPSRKPSC